MDEGKQAGGAHKRDDFMGADHDGLAKPKGPTPVEEGETLALIAFFVLGVGNMLPWNAFITAAAYYRGQFCHTAYESSFLSYFSMMFTTAQPLALMVNVFYHKRFSIQTLVRVPLALYTAVFVLTTVMVGFPSIPADALFAVTLLCIFAVGLTGSMMNGGLLALAGILAPRHTSAIMSGQAMAGFLVALVQLLATAATRTDCGSGGDDDDETCDSQDSVSYGDLAYFVVACVMLCVCVGTFQILWGLPFIARHRRSKMGRAQRGADIDDDTDADTVSQLHAVVAGDKAAVLTVDSSGRHRRGSDDSSHGHGRSGGDAYSTSTASGTGLDLPHVLAVAWRVRVPAFSVFVTKMGTLMAFPALMAQISPVGSCHSSRFLGDLWLPSLFLFNNAGDLLGRLAAGNAHHWHVVTPANLHVLSGARLALPVLFLFCHIGGNHIANVFNSDAVPPLLVLALGLSNGFLANLAMMMGPGLVDVSQQPMAGTIMGLALVMGLLVGALLSFLMVFLVTGA